MSDWEFIFDGVFGFLKSPLWTVPINSFIEEQSIVFENSEVNHLAWTEIHGNYKALLENLLDSYLKDVGITEEQFMEACSSPSAQHTVEIKLVLKQIMAGEDFLVFKKMMIEKNVELQMQALSLIKNRQGVKQKQVFEEGGALNSENEMLKEVIRQSEIEHKNEQMKKSQSDQEFEALMEEAISKSKQVEERLKKILEDEDIPDNKFNEQLKDMQIEQSSKKFEFSTQTKNSNRSVPSKESSALLSSVLSIDHSLSPNLPSAPPMSPIILPRKAVSPKKSDTCKSPNQFISSNSAQTECILEQTGSDLAAQWIASAKQEAQQEIASSSSQSPKNPQNSQQREQYLKQQRDKLLVIKKQEREKQLEQYSKEVGHTETSHFALSTFEGASNQVIPAPDEKKIAMRRALAEKLKKEVIHK